MGALVDPMKRKLTDDLSSAEFCMLLFVETILSCADPSAKCLVGSTEMPEALLALQNMTVTKVQAKLICALYYVLEEYGKRPVSFSAQQSPLRSFHSRQGSAPLQLYHRQK